MGTVKEDGKVHWRFAWYEFIIIVIKKTQDTKFTILTIFKCTVQ